MGKPNKIAFLFPGQGAQYPGMGKDFVESYACARETLEEADDLLGRKLSDVTLRGPADMLMETENCQPGIYVTSLVILRVLQEMFPALKPHLCAGLSLGEYTAATAAEILPFTEGLPLVQRRGQLMDAACRTQKGEMAVILGLSADEVTEIVKGIDFLWAANFNCPGQVVISGTPQGVHAGVEAAKAKGARRVMRLQVQGAFHSGLMQPAREALQPEIEHVSLNTNGAPLIMNVTGQVAQNPDEVRKHLIEQVTGSVYWEQGVRQMLKEGVDLFLEIGCGKALTGFNKRIGVPVPTLSIETVQDLKALEQAL